jgi:hypothetical protein
MTYLQWVQAVLDLGARRGYRMTAQEFRHPQTGQLWHVIYGFADACGLYFTGTSGEGIEKSVKPEEFFYAQPCEKTLAFESLQKQAGSQNATGNRTGRYVPRIPARAVHLSLERLFA